MNREKFVSVFSLTQDAEWIAVLQEFFEETAVRYFHFSNEKDLLGSGQKSYSLGFIETSLVTQPKSFTGVPLLKLGKGEGPGLNVAGRLDKGTGAGDFTQRVLSALAEVHDPLSVLLVDDDRDFCEVLKGLWEAKHDPRTEVRIALNAVEAFECLESFSPDVVVIDLKMPAVGGAEFYRKLRQKNHTAAAVILSAITASEETTALRSLGNPVCVEKSSGESLPEALWWRLLKLKVFGSRDLR